MRIAVSRCRLVSTQSERQISASAETVNESLMTLLNSNWAAVTTTEHWIEAVEAGHTLTRGNLAESAIEGRSGSGAKTVRPVRPAISIISAP